MKYVKLRLNVKKFSVLRKLSDKKGGQVIKLTRNKRRKI